MTYQSQSNGYVAYKVQSGLGTQATGSGGTILRTAGGQGGRLTKAATESNEARRDGMRTRGRHGTQKTAGTWSAEASLGSHEAIIEAVMRDTWSAADLQLDESDFTSITTGANTIVLAAGDPRTLGLRVGDVIRLTSHASAGNNSRNLRITLLSSTTITVAETLTVNATPDTDCEITRPGKVLTQFSAGSFVKRYFTIDEYDMDIDQSEVMTDFVWGSLRFSMQPNGIIMADPGGVGTGRFEALATGSSPLLTTPTEPAGVPFAVVDATIRLGSTDVVDLTSFDLTLDIAPNAPDTFGSGAVKYAPDVFPGQMAVSMNLTALRKDLQFIQDYVAETVYSLHVLAVDLESEPKDFLSIYVGNFSFGGVDKSALSRQGGPRTQTVAVPAALIGRDTRGTGYDPTMVKFQSTAA
ncbi:MAG: phage tail tube protein [Acetobacteraceae bacterium]